MQDVSGFGARVTIVASNTFPQGIDITAFSEDADPFDLPAVTIGATAMGPNGDLIAWSSAAPTVCNVNVIPGSDDDVNLGVLFQANAPGKGRQPANDVITLTCVYPDGRQVTLSNAKMISGMPGSSIAGSGRQKTKAYVFHAESSQDNS